MEAYARKNLKNHYFYFHHCEVENAMCYLKHYRQSGLVDSVLCAVIWWWYRSVDGVTSFHSCFMLNNIDTVLVMLLQGNFKGFICVVCSLLPCWIWMSVLVSHKHGLFPQIFKVWRGLNVQWWLISLNKILIIFQHNWKYWHKICTDNSYFPGG